MKKNFQNIILSLFLLFSAGPLFAQDGLVTRILFIVDASQSMKTNWGNTSRMEGAKKILAEMVDSLGKVEHLEMALRVYGHQHLHSLNNCKDTRLLVGFSNRRSNPILIKSRLREIEPKGITPIAYSLEQSERDFPKGPNTRNIIILITDGEESCKGDPCAVSRELQKKQIVLKPFIIGLGDMSTIRDNLSCVGSFYEAARPEEFQAILKDIIKQVLDKTSVQVNLLDESGKPTETNVNMTFFNASSGAAQYNYYHTMNVRGHPDTLEVDPINNYDLTIHTLPPVVARQVGIESNKHNTIEVGAPQGDLKLKMSGSSGKHSMDFSAIVREAGTYNTVNVQGFNQTERYLTGEYDLEILTLPRIYMENVPVDQSQATTLEIPEPGLVTIHSNVELYGGIFIREGDELKKIYQLNDRILKETIALQPGNYTIIYRNKMNHSTEKTSTKTFRINSGGSIKLKL